MAGKYKIKLEKIEEKIKTKKLCAAKKIKTKLRVSISTLSG